MCVNCNSKHAAGSSSSVCLAMFADGNLSLHQSQLWHRRMWTGPRSVRVPAVCSWIRGIFGSPRLGCLRWGSNQEPGSVTVRVAAGNVARIVSGDTVLIGNFYPRSGQFWSNMEGVSVGPIREVDQDIELLIKDATCPFPWMSYTAGEPHPSGAVAGGHLDDGSATCVARVIHGGYAVIAYYSPKSSLAYYESGGTHTTTSMDILVLF